VAYLKLSLQGVDKLTAEDGTEYVDRQEEGIVGMDPAAVIWGQTSGGDHAVDMRVSAQILTPGMQDGEESDVGAQVFGVGGHLEKGLRTGAEQEVINDLLVLQRQWRELVRQGEDNMAVT